MKITYDEGVFEELLELSAYLVEDDEEIAQQFLDSCDITFRLLAANPLIGVTRDLKHPALSHVRMWRVKRFEKYLVFYIPIESGVRILHVFHSSRDYDRLFEEEI